MKCKQSLNQSMAYSLRLIRKAELDVAAALEWYFAIDKKLALDFLEELNAGLKLLQTYPVAFPTVHLDLRIFVLKRFPYKVVYLVNIDDTEIVIQSVTHDKRNPARWQDVTK